MVTRKITWYRLLAGVQAGLVAALLTGCGGSGVGPQEPREPDSGYWLGEVKGGDVGSVALPSEPGVGDETIYPAASVKIVDEDKAERGGNPQGWYRATGVGYDSDMLWTYANGSSVDDWMRWKSGLGAGEYEVKVYVPCRNAGTQNARYRVQYRAGTAWRTLAEVRVNQAMLWNDWVPLGSWSFPGEPAVYLTDATGEPLYRRVQIGFDAVCFNTPASAVSGAKAAIERAHEDFRTQPNLTPGTCLAIVATRWSQRPIIGCGSAKEAMDIFRSKKVLQTGDPAGAPPGAWVFYLGGLADATRGHVGLKCTCPNMMVHQRYDSNFGRYRIVHDDLRSWNRNANYYKGYVVWEDVVKYWKP